MGTFILKDPQVSVNGVDLSRYVREVAVTTKKAEVDDTSSGDGGMHRKAGLNDDSFQIKFKQDFDASKVDATLWPLFDNETEFEVEVAKQGTISDTNPEYAGNCILTDYTPLSGAIGSLGEVQVTFPVNGKITRETT